MVNDCNGTASAALAACTLTGNVTLTAATAVTGTAGADAFATRILPAGDVDGDGADDLLVGAHRNDEGGAQAGKSYLLLSPW